MRTTLYSHLIARVPGKPKTLMLAQCSLHCRRNDLTPELSQAVLALRLLCLPASVCLREFALIVLEAWPLACA